MKLSNLVPTSLNGFKAVVIGQLVDVRRTYRLRRRHRTHLVLVFVHLLERDAYEGNAHAEKPEFARIGAGLPILPGKVTDQVP